MCRDKTVPLISLKYFLFIHLPLEFAFEFFMKIETCRNCDAFAWGVVNYSSWKKKLFFIFFCGSNPSASECWIKASKCRASRDFKSLSRLVWDFSGLRISSKEGGRRWKSFHSLTAWKSYQNTHLFSHSFCLVLSAGITLFTTRFCCISSEPKLITQNFHYCKFSSDFLHRLELLLFCFVFVASFLTSHVERNQIRVFL